MATQTFLAHTTGFFAGTYSRVPFQCGTLVTNATTGYTAHAPMAVAGTFTSLKLKTAAAPGSGKSWTITLRVNGVDSALSITVSNSGTTGSSTGSVAVAVGDTVGYYITHSGSPSPAAWQVSLDFEPDDTGAWVYGWNGRADWSSTRYAAALYGEGFGSSSVNNSVAVSQAGTITRWDITLEATFSAGPSLTYVLRKNGVDQDGSGGTQNTTLVFTGGTAHQNATFSLAVALGDTLQVKCITSGSPLPCAAGTLRFESSAPELCQSAAGSISATAGYMWAVGSGPDGTQFWSATESARQDVVGDVGFAASGLIVRQGPAFGGAQTLTITFRVNGVDTALAVTISDATPMASTTGSVVVAPGDLLSYKAVASGSVATGGYVYIALVGEAPPKVGSFAFGADMDVKATRAISFNVDSASYIDRTPNQFTVHGPAVFDDLTVLGTLTAVGSSALGDLSDVNAPTPADGDVLTFDSGAGEWVNAVPSSGSGGGATSTGAAGSEPGSPTAGDLYFPNNGFYVERYSGSVWAPWGPIFPMTDPALAAPTTWLNQGSSTVSTANGGIVLRGAATGSGANVVARVKTAPSTPYTITAFILPTFFSKSFQGYGLCFRDSASGRLALFDILNITTGNATIVRSSKFTNATTFSADYTTIVTTINYSWLRITDNGTSRIVSVSGDGQTWVQIHSIGRTDFLTADQVGFHVSTENSATPNMDMVATLLSWKET